MIRYPLVLVLLVLGRANVALGQTSAGRSLYLAACANCHGGNGRGAPVAQLGFADPPLPDFTDCSYASREAGQDWERIAAHGGRIRAFSQRMPAFKKALTAREIQQVITYVRSLCTDASWPRGELNYPRFLLTEKAFPEDELVVSSSVGGLRGAREATTEVIFEKRFGARNQYEVKLPVATRQRSPARGAHWTGGQLGDVVLAYKRAVAHNGETGRILSVGSELSLPTGDAPSGFGTGTTIVEPFALAAIGLGTNGFAQFELGAEFPVNTQKAEREVFASAGIGNTIFSGGFGRAWTPMLEFFGARELDGGARVAWDAVPQLQVSLSRRQHIMFNAGLRVPMTERRGRAKEFVAYFLWDWFDGGLRDGWR